MTDEREKSTVIVRASALAKYFYSTVIHYMLFQDTNYAFTVLLMLLPKKNLNIVD